MRERLVAKLTDTMRIDLQNPLKPKYISLISMCFPLLSLPLKSKAFS